jgi:branched-chain amino acid transport system substrate-binding protein
MKLAIAIAVCLASVILPIRSTWAGKQYGPGASDAEIKVGNTMHYSGAASPYGTIGRSEAAYFRMVNDQGGINGRKGAARDVVGIRRGAISGNMKVSFQAARSIG